MPAEKYHKAYLEEQLAVEIREHLREDNLDPTRLPSYEYLNAKGLETRGLSKAVQRHYGEDMTLHQFLRQQGFGYAENGDWPTTHEETIKHLNGYRQSRRERNNDADTTLSTLDSALREILRTVQDVHTTDNLLEFARYDTETERQRCNTQIEEVIDILTETLSDPAAQNYIRYLREFYEYLKPRTRIDHNPVKQVDWQYDFDSSTNSDVQPLTTSQTTTLWQTLKQLPHRHDLTASVNNLAERHGLHKWQVFMMTLLVLGIGVGLRTSEYIRTNCREDWVLADNPHIEVPDRKNLPGEVPILVGAEFLEAFCDYMEITREDWNGKPFPSPQTASGSRSGNTLNNWFAALCEEADVRLSDGSHPTLQNLRQTWHERYQDVLVQHNVHAKLVADEAGTQNEDIVKHNYRTDAQERRTIRTLAAQDFEDALPIDGLPDEMSDVVDESDYYGTQATLDEY